jgi:hypothetical protein
VLPSATVRDSFLSLWQPAPLSNPTRCYGAFVGAALGYSTVRYSSLPGSHGRSSFPVSQRATGRDSFLSLWQPAPLSNPTRCHGAFVGAPPLPWHGTLCVMDSATNPRPCHEPCVGATLLPWHMLLRFTMLLGLKSGHLCASNRNMPSAHSAVCGRVHGQHVCIQS